MDQRSKYTARTQAKAEEVKRHVVKTTGVAFSLNEAVFIALSQWLVEQAKEPKR